MNLVFFVLVVKALRLLAGAGAAAEAGPRVQKGHCEV